MEARTLARAKTLPPTQNDWLEWGVILHRRLQCADEAADACELLAHVLWYHPPNHDDRERLAQLRVAEAVLALGNAFATDAADAALVGELRYGFVRPESDLVIVWAAKSDVITLRSRALQAYDRFVLFRGPINDLVDFEGAAALASKRRARRKKGEAFEEAGDDPVETVRAALQDHLEVPQTEGFAPFADAPRPGDASLKTEARKEIERLAAVVKSVDGVAACLVLVNGFAAARTLPSNESTILEAALRDVGDAIVEKSRAPDGSWAGAGAGFAAPSFELSACGTNARVRWVGEGEEGGCSEARKNYRSSTRQRRCTRCSPSARRKYLKHATRLRRRQARSWLDVPRTCYTSSGSRRSRRCASCRMPSAAAASRATSS